MQIKTCYWNCFNISKVAGMTTQPGTNLDHDAAFIITHGNNVEALSTGNAPDSVQTIVQGVLQTICVSVPDAHGS